MQDDAPKNAFLNRRDWGSYLRALQTAANHPKMMEAVSSGRAWFTLGATQARGWLVGGSAAGDKFSVG